MCKVMLLVVSLLVVELVAGDAAGQVSDDRLYPIRKPKRNGVVAKSRSETAADAKVREHRELLKREIEQRRLELGSLPALPRKDEGGRNFGLITSHMPKPGPQRFWDQGRRVREDDGVHRLKGNDTLEEYRGRPRIVAIGDEGECKAVLAEFAKRPFFDRCVKQEFRPVEFAVADSGYKTTGRPRVVLQDSDGSVLISTPNLSQGVAAFASALRDARPDYCPDLDPGYERSGVSLMWFLYFLLLPLVAVAAGVCGWLVARRPTQPPITAPEPVAVVASPTPATPAK